MIEGRWVSSEDFRKITFSNHRDTTLCSESEEWIPKIEINFTISNLPWHDNSNPAGIVLSRWLAQKENESLGISFRVLDGDEPYIGLEQMRRKQPYILPAIKRGLIEIRDINDLEDNYLKALNWGIKSLDRVMAGGYKELHIIDIGIGIPWR